MKKILFLVLGLILVSTSLAFAQCNEGRLQIQGPQRARAGETVNIRVTGFAGSGSCSNVATVYYTIFSINVRAINKTGTVQAGPYQGCCSRIIDFTVPILFEQAGTYELYSIVGCSNNYVGSAIAHTPNNANFRITVDPASKLMASIDSIIVEPFIPTASKECKISVNVTNRSRGIDTAAFKVKLTVEGKDYLSDAVQIAQGQSYEFISPAQVYFTNAGNNIPVKVSVIDSKSNVVLGKDTKYVKVSTFIR